MIRGIYKDGWGQSGHDGEFGDRERFFDQYFKRIDGVYLAGDAARRDADGYFWIIGRVDDVLNVAGHRIGTAEVESCLVQHPAVAEAAVIGFPDEITGEAVAAFVTLRGSFEESGDLQRELVNFVGERNWPLRQAKAPQVHAHSAKDPQRQDHASPVARNCHERQGQRRHHHARRHGRRGRSSGHRRRGVEARWTSRFISRGPGASRSLLTNR